MMKKLKSPPSNTLLLHQINVRESSSKLHVWIQSLSIGKPGPKRNAFCTVICSLSFSFFISFFFFFFEEWIMLHNIERTCPHKSFVLLNNSIYNMYMGLEEMKPGICNSNPLMSQDHIICINQSVAIQLSEGNNLHFVHSSSIRRSFGQSLHNILKASVQHKLGTNQPVTEEITLKGVMFHLIKR